MGLRALIAFQIALQVCVGLQIINGPKWPHMDMNMDMDWKPDMDMKMDIDWKPWDDDNKVSQDWKLWDLPAANNLGGKEEQGSFVKPHSEERKPSVLLKKKLDGGHPTVNQNLTSDLGASCSCGKLLLSSLGPAANYQPQAMGTYTM